MAKSITLGALIWMLVSWPALAAEDSVLLHCAGWFQNVEGKRHGNAENLRIARDGSWIMWDGRKRSRTKVQPKGSSWDYEFEILEGNEDIFFDPTEMSLWHLGGGTSRMYACFPIENPF